MLCAQTTDILCDLRGIDTGVVVLHQFLEEHQSLSLEVLGSGEDLVHVLHVLGIVCIELGQRRRVDGARCLDLTTTSVHFLRQLLHLTPCHHSIT